MPPPPSIPRYHLYAEAPSDVELDFLHVERVLARSSVHDWTIRPHAHPDHLQFLLLTEGGGRVRLEEEAAEFGPHTLIYTPAGVVHEYRFQPGSNGFVLTVAVAFAHSAVENDRDLGAALAAPARCLDASAGAFGDVAAVFADIEREFVWSGPGRRVAVKAHFQRLLVAFARAARPAAGPSSAASHRAGELVGRYRELVERRFRLQEDLPTLAAELGVTAARLNAACRAVTGKSALSLAHDRILIEAKRNLLYTGMTVTEAAAAVGFQDPAYFSRFFARLTGMAPGTFRARSRDGGAFRKRPVGLDDQADVRGVARGGDR